MKKKFLFFAAVIVGLISFTQAQTNQDRSDLEKERQQLQKDIQDIQGQYDRVKGQTKQSVGQLNILNRKINLQERYISNINKELRMIDDDIYRKNLEIYRLQKQFDTLKAGYARSVVYAYKNRSSYDYLNFIFSAGSFNDALKRIAYLKSYRAYQEKQVNTIFETQQLIAKRKEQQLGRKDQKNSALQNQTRQMELLADQRKEKDAVVSKLRSQEKDLQKQLAAKKKRDNELKNSLAAIVRREMDIAKKKADNEAKSNANNTTTSTNPSTNSSLANVSTLRTTRSGDYLNLNPVDIKLNSQFEYNRGKLPWPVDNGYVSIHFGRYAIEGTTVKGDNPGITISTPSPGVPVKCVFEGEVVGVFSSGGEMTVTVRHGKYFTTYSNLSSVAVKKGNTVSTGETLGRLAADDEGGGGGKLDFLLMIEAKNVNPETWLSRH
ncbi:MAG TPA: peptidoglycan DD-metalloendopeptidase family protein [Chitinophagaceae bacterium]|nr:peptidoglycan DD-metalloendopeptidase family protein [Chitinophagaceae bacterium]